MRACFCQGREEGGDFTAVARLLGTSRARVRQLEAVCFRFPRHDTLDCHRLLSWRPPSRAASRIFPCQFGRFNVRTHASFFFCCVCHACNCFFFFFQTGGGVIPAFFDPFFLKGQGYEMNHMVSRSFLCPGANALVFAPLRVALKPSFTVPVDTSRGQRFIKQVVNSLLPSTYYALTKSHLHVRASGDEELRNPERHPVHVVGQLLR